MRIIRETVAQDLIEYALLCGFVGLMGLTASHAIFAHLQHARQTLDLHQDQLNACTPNPISSGSTGC